MAAVVRLLKPSPLSSFVATTSTTFLRRCLLSTTTAASVADASVKSPEYPYSSPPPRGTGTEGRNIQWLFPGCPGVGKGTYASRLSALLGVLHNATGDLVHEELSSSGPLSC